MFGPIRALSSVVSRSFRRAPGVDARLWMDHRPPAARSLVVAHVRCDAATAFDYVSDFSRHSEWTTGAQRIQQLTPGPVGLGTRLRAEGFQGGRWWPADLEVTVFERPSRFDFTAAGGPQATEGQPHRHEYRFTPDGDGIRIEHERWDPTPDSILWHALGPVIIRVTAGVRSKTTRNLRDRLEEVAARKTA